MSLIKSALNIWWLQWTWPLKLASVLGFALIVLIIFIGIRGCGKPAPKFNQQEIQKAQQAIADNDRRTQVEILANSDGRVANIDANVAAGRNAMVNAIANSKAEWAQKSNQE